MSRTVRAPASERRSMYERESSSNLKVWRRQGRHKAAAALRDGNYESADLAKQHHTGGWMTW